MRKRCVQKCKEEPEKEKEMERHSTGTKSNRVRNIKQDNKDRKR